MVIMTMTMMMVILVMKDSMMMTMMMTTMEVKACDRVLSEVLIRRLFIKKTRFARRVSKTQAHSSNTHKMIAR